MSPGREDALRRVLEDAGACVPFAALTGVHFGRLFLTERNDEPGRPGISAGLVLMTEVDAPVERHLDELADVGGAGLDATFGLCDDYPEDPTPATRRAFLVRQLDRPSAAYVNTVGRTREQVLDEARLRDAIEAFLDERRAVLPDDPARLRAAIQDFVRSDPELAWALRPAPRPAAAWRAREVLHALLVTAVLVAAAPLVLLGLPAYAVALRRHEKADEEEHLRPSREHVAQLARLENFGAQNQFTAIGYVKPGPFRRTTIRAVLWLIDCGARHVFTRGDLAGVKTIHFARWVPVDDFRRVVFTSNYDGSLENYNDDFIDKVAFGLNAAFSNGVGYPRTRFLLFEGARHEQAFKDYLRCHQIPTQVWYSAYDHLSAANVEENGLIRSGLSGTLAPGEVRRWLRRL